MSSLIQACYAKSKMENFAKSELSQLNLDKS